MLPRKNNNNFKTIILLKLNSGKFCNVFTVSENIFHNMQNLALTVSERRI